MRCQPLMRQPAGVFQCGGVGAHGLIGDRLIVRPGNIETARVKPVGKLHWRTKKNVVVQIEKTFRQVWNTVDIGLDIARVKGGQ